jgi:serine/threonine-protein kinase RsbW
LTAEGLFDWADRRLGPAPPRDRRPAASPDGPTLLALRSPPELVPVLHVVVAAMAAQGYPARDIFGMRLALEEALANALKHGHGYDPARVVRVRCRVTAEQALAEVEDEGPGFDPGLVPDPLADANLGLPSGRGLLLMRHYLSWVQFSQRGNRVTLCRRRSGP